MRLYSEARGISRYTWGERKENGPQGMGGMKTGLAGFALPGVRSSGLRYSVPARSVPLYRRAHGGEKY
jgi:hypothetical protein